jgi:hypothetical protein
LASVAGDDDVANVADIGEQTPRLELCHRTVGGTRHGGFRVCPAKCVHDSQRIEMRAGDPGRIQFDRYLAWTPTDHSDFGHLRHVGDRLAQLAGDGA